jgi:hypothetical protein
MLLPGDDAAGPGDAFCAMHDTASAIRIGSAEMLFTGFSPFM